MEGKALQSGKDGLKVANNCHRLLPKHHTATRVGQEYQKHSTIRITLFYVFIVLSRLMTWGAGKFGQLGNNCRDDSLDLQDITDTVPQEAGKIVQVCRNAIRIFLKVYEDFPTQVSAGCGHSGFITENGHAFTFGDDRYNQLGTGWNYHNIIIMTQKLISICT